MTLVATVIIAMVPTTAVLPAVTMVVPIMATTGMATVVVATMVAMMVVIMATTTEEPQRFAGKVSCHEQVSSSTTFLLAFGACATSPLRFVARLRRCRSCAVTCKASALHAVLRRTD